MLALMMYLILCFFLSERSETMACSSFTLCSINTARFGPFMNSLIVYLRVHTRERLVCKEIARVVSTAILR